MNYGKKYILSLFIIIAISLVAVFFVNGPLLEGFYRDKKIVTMKNTYEEINSAFNAGNINSEEFDLRFQSIIEKNNVNIVILDADSRTIKASSHDYERLSMVLMNYIFGHITDTDNSEKIYEESNHKYEIHLYQDTKMSAAYLDLWGILDNGDPLLIRSPLEGIKDASRTSSRYFNIIIIVLVVFATTAFSVYGHHNTIVELKKKNEKLEYDIKQKEELDNMRSEFVSAISHELKTPIAIIQGYAEGLRECVNQDEESREFYCEVIMDEASKMNDMVKKMIDISHIEFGDIEFNYSDFDIVELVNNYIKSVKILYENKDIHLIINPDHPIYVNSDVSYIEEIINNYFTNALNYVSGDRIIEIDIINKNDNKVEVSVFNTGSNIPSDSISKVFDKFYKVDKSRSREYGGNGVGLSIVRAIMQKMNQKYGVENFNDGVRFYFEVDASEESVLL